MIDIVFHVGTEHPSFLWLGATSLFSFAAGLAIGLFASNRNTDESAQDIAARTE